jgi:hypothetical protein
MKAGIGFISAFEIIFFQDDSGNGGRSPSLIIVIGANRLARAAPRTQLPVPLHNAFGEGHRPSSRKIERLKRTGQTADACEKSDANHPAFQESAPA